MNKLDWVNILAQHIGCKNSENLPTIDVVFQEFENLQHDCLVYSQSGFIRIDHTVH
jgi:hypothetical protein